MVVFKKTTIKDDDARRKHVAQEEERKADPKKKYKCRDYVVIGDPANELKKISLDEFYKNFTGVLLLLNPTAEFKGGTGKHKVEGRQEAKEARNHMLKRFVDLLGDVYKRQIIGIVSTVFNKALMDEVLPYGLKNLLVALIVVFSVVNVTSALISTVRQWILIYLSIKVDIPLMLGYFDRLPSADEVLRITQDRRDHHPLLRRQHHQVGADQHGHERGHGCRDGGGHGLRPVPDELLAVLHYVVYHHPEPAAGHHLQAAVQADQ